MANELPGFDNWFTNKREYDEDPDTCERYENEECTCGQLCGEHGEPHSEEECEKFEEEINPSTFVCRYCGSASSYVAVKDRVYE